MKVLIIQNKRIGDVLLTSVLAENIKKNYPDSIVHFFCYDYTVPVIRYNIFIDQIISVDAQSLKKIPVLLKYCRKVKRENYDLILDPYAKFQSKLMCYLSGATKTAGFIRKVKKTSFQPYTIKVPYKSSSTMDCGKTLDDRVSLCDAALPLKTKIYQPKIYLEELEQPQNKTETKPIIIIGVLGSTPSKSLPKETMADIINRTIKSFPDHQIVFNYAPHQKQEAAEIYDLIENKKAVNEDAYEPDLDKFLHLLKEADVLVSNEGGAVHMAKALEVPTFTIFSPFIDKATWNSFENLPIHTSIHLRDQRPDLYQNVDRKSMKKIESEPIHYYRQLDANMIWHKLGPYLNLILKQD
ncbi:hypothetical protein BST97_06360 [Nonlabens spongiae]|uniref:ADP-heptose--LPS heptosyltransferase n=1 Tax=Nonlabens spongiae TaxID=331648 RepID=A0A1W6MJA8_9FLAO|nr:glycosyltransferase family 9 protein [Nonlabens spongiae]ARN77647.1 hypothetical protein BST97_06360 [Nonlabens spongiae]